jgi:hypothetical protein
MVVGAGTNAKNNCQQPNRSADEKRIKRRSHHSIVYVSRANL